MTIEQALWQYVTESAAMSALIGTRFYPVILPDVPTYPAGTYERISTPRVWKLDGPSGLAYPRFQINWWIDDQIPGASGYAAVSALAETARKVLDGYTGLMGTVRVLGVQLINERDDYEPKIHVRRRSQDYVIWHPEDLS